MAAVFISYAHDDYEFVRGFADKLRNVHILVWLDRNRAQEGRGIDPGTEWAREIQKGIEECAAVVRIISPALMRSKYVKKETKIAINAQKPIFDYIYEDVESLPAAINKNQYLKASNPDSMDRLIEELGKIEGVFDSSLSTLGLNKLKTLTFETAKQHVQGWWEDISLNGKLELRLIGLPFLRTRYCQVYLVGQPDTSLAWQPIIQVGLQLTGDYPENSFIEEIATTFIGEETTDFALHLLLIRGPLQVVESRGATLEYALDAAETEQWEDALHATKNALDAYGQPQNLTDVQIFAKAPVMLMYEWGKRAHITRPYTLYHYNRAAAVNKRYAAVFTD